MNRSRVTGNLSSHGILFSDITNDRVGIGSTIPTQKLDVTGVVKATSFVGSGANLTGIDATTIKHTDGNIKAQAIATGVNVTGNLNVSVDLDVTDEEAALAYFDDASEIENGNVEAGRNPAEATHHPRAQQSSLAECDSGSKTVDLPVLPKSSNF